MNKKQIRTKRLDIIHQLSRLEAVHCRNCPKRSGGAVNRLPEKTCKGCPIFPQIRALGDSMDALAQSSKVEKIPAELTISAYHELIGLEWTNHAIRKHYKIDVHAFQFFLSSHGVDYSKHNRKKETK